MHFHTQRRTHASERKPAKTPPSCVSDTNLFVVGVQPRGSVNCNLPVVSRIHRNV